MEIFENETKRNEKDGKWRDEEKKSDRHTKQIYLKNMETSYIWSLRIKQNRVLLWCAIHSFNGFGSMRERVKKITL